jgi:hypothetical protein
MRHVPTHTAPQDDDPEQRSSHLDPEETSSGLVRNPLVPAVDDERYELVARFRHSFWQDRRPHVRAALAACFGECEALERFDLCGANCWVMRATDGSGRLRLAADRCHCRWCEACATERRRLIARNLLTKLQERYHLPNLRAPAANLRFLTLTLRHTDQPLREQMDRLFASWGKLRNRKEIKPRLTGGIAFFEIKVSSRDNRWHPHLHILCEGDYLAHDVLRRLWLEITGDSSIVDIRRIRTVIEAGSYVAKYAAKGVDHSVWRSPDRLHEAMLAFRGRRTFNTFGTFTRLGLSKPPEDDVGWEPVAPLHRLLSDAARGVAEAIQILRSLKGGPCANPVDGLIHVPSPP